MNAANAHAAGKAWLSLLLVGLLAGSISFAASCRSEPENDAQEHLREAGEEMREAGEAMGESARDAIEEAGDAIEDATDRD